jgi:hypothetical protein
MLQRFERRLAMQTAIVARDRRGNRPPLCDHGPRRTDRRLINTLPGLLWGSGATGAPAKSTVTAAG